MWIEIEQSVGEEPSFALAEDSWGSEGDDPEGLSRRLEWSCNVA